MSNTPPSRIVALALDTLGDQVLRQPLYAGLLDHGHRVHVVVRPQYAAIVRHIDARLAVIACPVDPAAPVRAMHPVLSHVLGEMRAAMPTLVAALAFTRTALDEWLLRNADWCDRIGFADTAGASSSSVDAESLPAEMLPALAHDATLSWTVRVERDLPEWRKAHAMLQAIEPAAIDAGRPRLASAVDATADAQRFLREHALTESGYAVMSPAGTQNVALKRMPPELAAAAIERLSKHHHVATVLTGIEAERAHLDAVGAAARARGSEPLTWIGDADSLAMLCTIVERSRLYVGSDSGTMHLAAALDKPVVALFGGGMFPRFEPAAPRWAAVTKRLPCFGCDWHCVFESPLCIDEVGTPTFLGALDAVVAGQSPRWILDPAGLDEQAARRVEPHFAHLRARLDVAEREGAERLRSVDTLHAEVTRLQRHLAEVEGDRGARGTLIEQQDAQISVLGAKLNATEAGLAERLALIDRQDAELKDLQARFDQAETDRAERLALIERQDIELKELGSRFDRAEADRAERLALIERQDHELRELRGQFGVVEADRARRLEVIEQQAAELDRLGKVQAELDGQRRALATARREGEARLAEATDRLATTQAGLERTRAELARLEARVRELETLRGALRSARRALMRTSVPDAGDK